MSEQDKRILEGIAMAVREMDDMSKARFAGIAEGFVMHKDKTDTQQSTEAS